MTTNIVRMQFGSHLYGTDTPSSDFDYKAVHVPSARDILLQRVQGSIGDKRDKVEGEKNLAGEVEEESYSLQRYLHLLVDGQTVAIDMLFAPKPIEASELWYEIKNNSHLLLTRKSAAFVGYCRQQANKYGIKGSRVAAARDVAEHLKDLLEAYPGQSKLRDYEMTLACLLGEHVAIVEQVVNRAGDTDRFLEVCNRKLAFDGTLKQAYEVVSAVSRSYGDRAKLASENKGVDWKALSHAVRVGEEALELLATGRITFPLHNAPSIRAIKRGLLPYAEVATRIEELLVSVEEAAKVSVLRDEADMDFVDDLVARAYEAEVRS